MVFFALETSKNAIKKLPIKQFLIFSISTILLIFAVLSMKDKLIHYSSSTNARKAIFLTSLDITQTNLGLGEGFGRFGSAVSTRHYSPLYYKYGINLIYGASPEKSNFITDQWWGWYIGESGIIGMIFFLLAIYLIGSKLITISRACHYENKQLSILSYTALGSMIYGICSGFASAGLSGPPSSYLIMGLSALAISISYHWHWTAMRRKQHS